MEYKNLKNVFQFWFGFQLSFKIFRLSVTAEPQTQLLCPTVLLGSNSQASYAKAGKMQQKSKCPKYFALILKTSKLVLRKYLRKGKFLN